MTTVLIIAAIICILEFIVVTAMAVCQLFPKKEEKPTNKTPIEIELQIEYEGYLYTLYTDGTWELDITW